MGTPSISPSAPRDWWPAGARSMVSTSVTDTRLGPLGSGNAITMGLVVVASVFRGLSKRRLSVLKSRNAGRSARDQWAARTILSGVLVMTPALRAATRTRASAPANVGRRRRS